MKKTTAIAAAAILLFAACKKDETTPVTPPTIVYDNHSSPLMKMMHDMDADMNGMKMTMDPDHDFAMMMKMHHMGAVKMADYELTNGTDATIKAMAQKMKDAQKQEISMMDSFMMAHTPSNMSMVMMDSLNVSMKRMTTSADAQTLKGTSDHDFVHLMIVHHQSAVEMAAAEMMYGKNTFMKDMASMMKMDQMHEISDMQTWLKNGND